MIDIKEFEELYAITEDGRVWSKRRQRFLNCRKGKLGYDTASLNINGKSTYKKIHRLVAEAFIPNPDNKPYINHIDGDKLNNHVDNLEWVTPSENTRHAFATGLIPFPKGEANGRAKLTEEQVIEIKKLIKEGSLSLTEIGKIFKAIPQTISNIKLGKSWTHIIEGEE